MGINTERRKRMKAFKELMRTPGGEQWLKDHVGKEDLPKGAFMKREIKSLRNPHFEEDKPPLKPLKVKDLITVLSALTEKDKDKIVVFYNMEYSRHEPIKSIQMLDVVESRMEEYEEPSRGDKRKTISVVELCE